MPRALPSLWCTKCDDQLDLAKRNYVVGERPWCARCAGALGGGVMTTLARTLGTMVVIGGLCGAVAMAVGAADALALETRWAAAACVAVALIGQLMRTYAAQSKLAGTGGFGEVRKLDTSDAALVQQLAWRQGSHQR